MEYKMTLDTKQSMIKEFGKLGVRESSVGLLTIEGLRDWSLPVCLVNFPRGVCSMQSFPNQFDHPFFFLPLFLEHVVTLAFGKTPF